MTGETRPLGVVRVAWIATVTVAVLACALVAVFVLPEMNYWAKRERLDRVAVPARILALWADDHHARTGRYPGDRREYENLRGGQGAELLRQIESGMASSGVAPQGFTATARPAAGAPLAEFTARDGFVRLLAAGKVEVSRNLAPAREVRPRWLVVAETPNRLTGSGGG